METNGLNATEAECAAGRTAPRVSLDDIKANIAHELFTTGAEVAGRNGLGVVFVPPSLGVLTICLLVLRNGSTIIGKSAPADVRNFDAELGKKLAYEDAVRQVWPLMGYELRERLHRAPVPAIAVPEDMVRFMGTKVVDARSMTRAAYNEFRGWALPPNEDGSDEGYLIHYTDGGKPNVDGFEGYVSWSPKEQFDRAYRPF